MRCTGTWQADSITPIFTSSPTCVIPTIGGRHRQALHSTCSTHRLHLNARISSLQLRVSFGALSSIVLSVDPLRASRWPQSSSDRLRRVKRASLEDFTRSHSGREPVTVIYGLGLHRQDMITDFYKDTCSSFLGWQVTLLAAVPVSPRSHHMQ